MTTALGEREANITLTVAAQVHLDVRRIVIDEDIGRLFRIEATVLANDAELAFDKLVGHPATVTLEGVDGTSAQWHGLCAALEQIQCEPNGASTYVVRVVPALWLLTQRVDYRVFQQKTEPEIAQEILNEWKISFEMRIDAARYKARDYCVQYAETDFDFITRVLENAGIAFCFELADGVTTLILSDALDVAEPRPPLRNIDNPTRRLDRCVWNVKLRQELRPGRVVLADHDFRRPPALELSARATAARFEAEDDLELFSYAPGAFLFGGDHEHTTPVADDRGAFRTMVDEGKRLAENRLHAARGPGVTCRFSTTDHQLRPGQVVSIAEHRHPDLAAAATWVVVSSRIRATHSEEVEHDLVAQTASTPFRSATAAPKPFVRGVESAMVVGPEGEEIHVDELGRVRVQFHWDRRGGHDETSSCWVHVSQQWAGSAFGSVALPRIGQEVLVDFLGGDPDRPIVVGRVYTVLQTPPFRLPQHKTRSAWRSRSTPGGAGFNEIMFEDATGAELFNVQAERDLIKIVKNDEDVVIGNNRDEVVRHDASESIGHSSTLSVGVDRNVSVGALSTHHAGERYELAVAPVRRSTPTSVTMTDEKIVLDTGVGATVTLEGDTVVIRADRIRLEGQTEVSTKVEKGDLRLIGGPMVKVNC